MISAHLAARSSFHDFIQRMNRRHFQRTDCQLIYFPRQPDPRGHRPQRRVLPVRPSGRWRFSPDQQRSLLGSCATAECGARAGSNYPRARFKDSEKRRSRFPVSLGQASRPTGTTPPFPLVLSLRFNDRLPLQVLDAGSAARERPDMVFDVAGAGAGRPPRGRARMLTLKFVLDGIRAMSSG
jgi:hypothetical protein